jgi:hypothetical protein
MLKRLSLLPDLHCLRLPLECFRQECRPQWWPCFTLNTFSKNDNDSLKVMVYDRDRSEVPQPSLLEFSPVKEFSTLPFLSLKICPSPLPLFPLSVPLLSLTSLSIKLRTLWRLSFLLFLLKVNQCLLNKSFPLQI